MNDIQKVYNHLGVSGPKSMYELIKELKLQGFIVRRALDELQRRGKVRWEAGKYHSDIAKKVKEIKPKKVIKKKKTKVKKFVRKFVKRFVKKKIPKKPKKTKSRVKKVKKKIKKRKSKRKERIKPKKIKKQEKFTEKLRLKAERIDRAVTKYFKKSNSMSKK